jgi:hypothetical protein
MSLLVLAQINAQRGDEVGRQWIKEGGRRGEAMWREGGNRGRERWDEGGRQRGREATEEEGERGCGWWRSEGGGWGLGLESIYINITMNVDRSIARSTAPPG